MPRFLPTPVSTKTPSFRFARWLQTRSSAGLTTEHDLAIRITDPYGHNTKQGHLPARVTGLDENFLVFNSECGQPLSNGIGGFHLYVIDICFVANMLGYNAYVIDVRARHVGGRSIETMNFALRRELDASRSRLIAACARRMKSRRVGNTSAQFFISGSRLSAPAMNSKIA